MKKNGSGGDKKLYMFLVDMQNYSFLAAVAGDNYSMALILNRLIENARGQDETFIEKLLRPPNPI